MWACEIKSISENNDSPGGERKSVSDNIMFSALQVFPVSLSVSCVYLETDSGKGMTSCSAVQPLTFVLPETVGPTNMRPWRTSVVSYSWMHFLMKPATTDDSSVCCKLLWFYYMLVTLGETCNQTQFIRLLHTSMVYHMLVTLNKTCNHNLFFIIRQLHTFVVLQYASYASWNPQPQTIDQTVARFCGLICWLCLIKPTITLLWLNMLVMLDKTHNHTSVA